MQGKRNKILTSITAIVCIVALLVGGTLAWRGVSGALNEFSALRAETPEPTEPGANLHDDFDPATGDKNIYVENTGDSDVYVRVKLEEVFANGSNEAPNPLTWATFKPADATALANSGTYYNAYDDAFSWTLGNDAEYEYQSIVGSTEWDATTNRAEKDDLVADALGGAKAASTIVDMQGVITETKEAPAGTVISMGEYKLRTDKDTWAGWVYDTDGYAYWSQPLGKDETTSLLLNGVKIPAAGSET